MRFWVVILILLALFALSAYSYEVSSTRKVLDKYHTVSSQLLVNDLVVDDN